MARQSHSSPYIASLPSLYYDSAPNNTHGTHQEPSYGMSSQLIYYPRQHPEYWSPSAYRGSGDTYQQARVQYPNTEQSSPPLYPAQNQQQHVVQRARICVIPRKNTLIKRQQPC